MDGFPTLPIEIARLILVQAVRVRGIKRAARLRFVSQSWNREVTEVIFQSGILDDLQTLRCSPLWPRYLTYKTMHQGTPLSRQLCIIRRVAERVLLFRGEGSSEDALGTYIFEIFQICQDLCCFHLHITEQMESLEDSDEDFKEALLAAAACTNDIALVKQLLPAMQDCLYMIAQDGWHNYHAPTIGYPMDVAAFKGNVEVMRMFLKALKDPRHIEFARYLAAEWAGQGNHMGAVELCLDPVYTAYDRSLLDIVNQTTSTEIFDRVLPLCKDHLDDDWRNAPSEPQDVTLKRFLGFRLLEAVKHGELSMVRHLVELGVSPRESPWPSGDNERGYNTFISNAAAGGHMAILAYLLENGATIASRALEAASRHGNPGCVRLLLEHGAMDSFKPGSALLEAVKRENEPVVRQLMESAMTMDDSIKGQALDMAFEEGLVSISEVIREYK